ncbi:endocuticle structural protein SgAbd-6-like [Vanessa atalanta]|uniref:endocuticle structural protein SgAbd-6-like n=1 Tax=Vanessa atalanta TaxID=42275 RepID=UPI001FCDF276|nr:endocuticle structural protein SgAbd-6-like [Vanessa atalanta]
MVKGVRFCLYAVIVYVIIDFFSKCDALETQVKDYIYNNNGLGTYSFEFETIDGTFRREDGGIASNAKGVVGFVVRGVYGFIDPEGRHHSVRYIADADGYQPQADDGDVRYNDRRIV